MPDATVTVVARQGDEHEDVVPMGNLFDGIRFFLLQRVPLRSELIKKIKSNGGSVVRHEQAADYLIADHARQDSPEGSISWTFIDASFRAKALANPDEHRIVSRHRPTPGQSSKTRTPFTAEDDRVLWEWVEQAKNDGGLVKGNEIYKQLERHNPRHTFHAWRDRYIKKLISHPPAETQSGMETQAPPEPTPAVDLPDGVASAVSKGTTILRSDDNAQHKIVPNVEPANGVAQNDGVKAHALGRGRSVTPNRPLGGSHLVGSAKEKQPTAVQSISHSEPSEANTAVDPSEGPERRKRQKLTKEFTTSMPKHRDAMTIPPSSFEANDTRAAQQDNTDALGTFEEAGAPPVGNAKRPIRDGDFQIRATAETHAPQTALTEANLASQQAMQKDRPIRGIDLPEDDHMQDQGSFAEYLTNLLRQSQKETRPGVPSSTPQIAAQVGEAAMQAIPHSSSKNASSPNRGRTSSSSAILTPTQHPKIKETLNRENLLPTLESNEFGEQGTKVHSKSAVHIDASEVNELEDEDMNDIDLTCPAPENGWGFDASQGEPSPSQHARDKNTNTLRKKASQKAVHVIYELSSQSSSTSGGVEIPPAMGNEAKRSKDDKGTEVETQDIMNAETQPLDLDMPAPPGLDDGSRRMKSRGTVQPSSDSRRSNSSSRPTRRNDIVSADNIVDDLPTWAAIMRNRGYTPVAIINALKVCSARTDLAELVLLEERSGRGLPKDIPGIWSEQEDRILESGDARGLRRLEEKHGWDDCQARLQHLADRREP